MCGKYQKGRQNIKTPTLGNELGVMEGEEGGGGGEWVTCTDGLSTGCYSVCGQIEYQ